MPESEIYKIVIQGGSFAVLVLLVVWTIYKGIPKALELHEKTVTSMMDRHDKELSKRDAALSEQTAVIRDVATGLKDVVIRLERLEEKNGM